MSVSCCTRTYLFVTDAEDATKQCGLAYTCSANDANTELLTFALIILQVGIVAGSLHRWCHQGSHVGSHPTVERIDMVTLFN